MGIDALIPVKEALHVDHVANFQLANGGINIAVSTGEIDLNAELIGSAIVTQSNIDIVAGLTVLILDGLDGHTGKGNEFVLMSDQLVSAKQLGDIQSLSDVSVAALDKLEGTIHDLHFAGPLALVTVNTDLGTGNQLGSILLRAGELIEEISAIGALAVNGDLVVPPALMVLDIGLHHNSGVQLGSSILLVGHDGDGVISAVGSSVIGSIVVAGSIIGGSVIGAVISSIVCCVIAGATGYESQSHGHSQQQCKNLLHDFSPYYFGCSP